MPHTDDLHRLVEELGDLVGDAALAQTLEGAEIRRVLSFVSQVIIVVEQAFQDVLTVLVEVKYLEDTNEDRARLVELRKRTELLTARSHYRDAAEICSRLRHLGENYETFVRASVEKLPGHSKWHSIFGLIQEQEGQIIILIESTAFELGRLLENAEHGSLSDARNFATNQVDELRLMLSDLQSLNGQILGLSGTVGFLEMTRDRHTLEREVRVFVDKRDQRVIHGHNVEVGDGNVFHGDVVVATTIQDSFNQAKEAPTDDLRQSLDLLCKQVEEMVKQMPSPNAAEVAQDLSTFVKEASKEEPRRKWYELSADGIIDAAKAFAGATSPIIATIHQILRLLP